MSVHVLGIDIGGSALKYGLVDVLDGRLVGESEAIKLALKATPARLLETIESARNSLSWTGPIGIGYPGVVKNGRTMSAAHLDDSFLGLDWLSQLKSQFGDDVALINDADAAGLAEARFGAGAEATGGSILVITLGTGIGTAFVHNGRLFPNTEFGHMLLGEVEAEDLAAGSVKKHQNLSWEEFGTRLTRFLREMERLGGRDAGQ